MKAVKVGVFFFRIFILQALPSLTVISNIEEEDLLPDTNPDDNCSLHPSERTYFPQSLLKSLAFRYSIVPGDWDPKRS